MQYRLSGPRSDAAPDDARAELAAVIRSASPNPVQHHLPDCGDIGSCVPQRYQKIAAAKESVIRTKVCQREVGHPHDHLNFFNGGLVKHSLNAHMHDHILPSHQVWHVLRVVIMPKFGPILPFDDLFGSRKGASQRRQCVRGRVGVLHP